MRRTALIALLCIITLAGVLYAFGASNHNSYRRGCQDGYVRSIEVAQAAFTAKSGEVYQQGYQKGFEHGQKCLQFDYNFDVITYDELKDWLKADDTNEVKPGNCVDFTAMLLDHAHSEGIASYPVVMNFHEGGGHVIAAFPTDKGEIYIEPMSDDEVNIGVGETYTFTICAESGDFCRFDYRTIKQSVVLR